MGSPAAQFVEYYQGTRCGMAQDGCSFCTLYLRPIHKNNLETVSFIDTCQAHASNMGREQMADRRPASAP